VSALAIAAVSAAVVAMFGLLVSPRTAELVLTMRSQGPPDPAQLRRLRRRLLAFVCVFAALGGVIVYTFVSAAQG
jgi:hypothetical protein